MSKFSSFELNCKTSKLAKFRLATLGELRKREEATTGPRGDHSQFVLCEMKEYSSINLNRLII